MTAGTHDRGFWSENDPFAELHVPEAFQASLERHRRNIGRLIVGLRSVGMSDKQIQTSVIVAVSSYKDELLRAIGAMVV